MQIHTGEKPICGNNLHICVYGCELKKEMSPIAHFVYILKMSVINARLARRFLKSICETHINFTQFFQHVGHVWLLFTSKNAVRVKYKRRRYVFVGFNRTHLIVLTISVIAAGQLNVTADYRCRYTLSVLSMISYQNNHGFNCAK